MRRFLSPSSMRAVRTEQRDFGDGFLIDVQENRAKLLAAALTILRYGRQHADELGAVCPLGSFEVGGMGPRSSPDARLCDPVERIERVKADDPHRREIVELFETWHAHHGEKPTTVTNFAELVRASLDPHGRGRQHVASRLSRLAGTRAAGFVLTRQPAAGKWGASTYALRRPDRHEEHSRYCS